VGEPSTPHSIRDPDQEALEACRRGERAAFDVLVERHHRRVFRLCVRLLSDEEGALDAAQETFVKAWRALARFEGGALFTTWLTRIAINTCRNELRRRGTKKHARPRSLEEPVPGTDVVRGDTLAAPTRPPWEEARGRELRAAFEEVLAALDPEDREVLLLKEVEGLSYEDMAEVLGIPTGTVRSRLHRARAEVRRRIAPVL
jgi:RNA polymerase sigma-70 factor (ECF subfamily)